MEVSNDKYSMNNGTSPLTQHSKQYTADGVIADTHHMQPLQKDWVSSAASSWC